MNLKIFSMTAVYFATLISLFPIALFLHLQDEIRDNFIEILFIYNILPEALCLFSFMNRVCKIRHLTFYLLFFSAMYFPKKILEEFCKFCREDFHIEAAD